MYSEYSRIPSSHWRFPCRSPPAAWHTRHPVLAAAGVAVAGTALTVVGSADGQILRLSGTAALWLLAGFVAASALAAVVWMKLTRRPLADYGLRAPENLRSLAWVAALFLAPLIVLAATGVQIPAAAVPAYLALTIAVGLSEEFWFRGLVLAAARGLGERRAVLIGAALFGVLHLTNALQGKAPVYLLLQVVLAFLVGWVLGELVAITRSLWIGVAWHTAFDFCSYLGGDALGTHGTLAAAAVDLLLLVIGLLLWRRMPVGATSLAR